MKGFLMTAENAVKVINGTKTMTRRTAGLEKVNENPDAWELSLDNGIHTRSIRGGFQFIRKPMLPDVSNLIACKPRYLPGETVYLKETWKVGAWDEVNIRIAVDYKLDNYSRKEWLPVIDYDLFHRLWKESTDDAEYAEINMDASGDYNWEPGQSPCRWRSPMFMPRCTARYFFKILSVRPERLRDIPLTDCISEGCGGYYKELIVAKARFINLWDSINGKKKGLAYSDNPWVWVIEFNKIGKKV